MIDLTPAAHAAVAVVMQIVIGILTGDWLTGGIIGCCWFIAREHTQAEYRWIARYGSGKRANLPVWGGFDIRVWDRGSVLDFSVPLLVCAVVYLVMSH